MREMGPSSALRRLFEEIGSCSSLEGACLVLDRRLRGLLPFHAMAVFLPSEGRLVPVFTSPGTPPPSGSAASGNYGSMLAVPLEDETGVIGILSLYSRRRNIFSVEDLGALLWIREDLARAFRQVLRTGSTASLAVPLEPGPDWPAVLEMLRAEIRRGASESLWVLLCHLERLAAIESRFGVAVRSRLVQAVAAGLSRACRSEDAVARDGDNFILTLRDLSAPQVESKKSSVAALVEGISLAQLGDRLVPLQAGAACFPHDASEPEQLLDLAARRLRPVEIPARSLTEDLARLAAALETGAGPPGDAPSEAVPVFVRRGATASSDPPAARRSGAERAVPGRRTPGHRK